ncbi:hypothetical protein SGPA1_31584 [Streptomyces misionensis JCM 4497]
MRARRIRRPVPRTGRRRLGLGAAARHRQLRLPARADDGRHARPQQCGRGPAVRVRAEHRLSDLHPRPAAGRRALPAQRRLGTADRPHGGADGAPDGGGLPRRPRPHRGGGGRRALTPAHGGRGRGARLGACSLCSTRTPATVRRRCCSSSAPSSRSSSSSPSSRPSRPRDVDRPVTPPAPGPSTRAFPVDGGAGPPVP